MFNQKFPPLYYVIQTFYSLCVGYAVIRYRLMDFDLLVRWGLAYGAVAAVSGAIFIGTIFATSFFFQGLIPGLPYWIGSIAFILTFDPIRKKIITFVDQYIFQSPDYKVVLEQISEILRASSDVEALAREMATKVKEIWKVDHAGIVLWEPGLSQFKPYPSEEFEKLGIKEEAFALSNADFLIRTLESERRLFQYGIVLEDELDVYGSRASSGERATFTKIARTMKKLGAAACVPISIKDQLIGFIVLGAKKSGALYNREDKKFLSHVGKLISEQINHLIYTPQAKPSAA